MLVPPTGSVEDGQPFKAGYVATNVSPIPVTGVLVFNFEGQAVIDPQRASGATVTLAPHASVIGQLQINTPVRPGGDLTAMARTTAICPMPTRRPVCFRSLGSASLYIGIGANLEILDTASHNPTYDTSDPTWAKKVCGSNTWLSGPSPKFEWTPVLDPGEAAESRVVALSGVVIAQKEAEEDVWFTHPFPLTRDANKGADWDFDVAWSSNPNYDYLAAPALKADADTATRMALARATGLANARAMHIETDSQFVPPAYRAAAADKVVIFGRWIVDCGHDIYQSEIHPPLMFVAGREGSDGVSTTTTVIGRPYLAKQTFGGQGLYDYLIGEVGKEAGKSLFPPFPGAAILGDKLSARSDVETMPFSGLQWMIYYVRPPRPAQANQRLSVTYRFKTRSGVVVQLFDTNDGRGTVGVSVLFNDLGYKPNPLPPEVDWTVPLAAIKAHDSLGPYIDGAQFATMAFGNPWMAALMQKGVTTSWYGIPAIVEAPDMTVGANALSQTTTTVVDDTQPFPIAGAVTVRWVDFRPFIPHGLKQ